MSALRKLCESLSECTFFNLSVGSLHLFLVTLRAEFPLISIILENHEEEDQREPCL